jgi:hypothetical protein
MLGFQASVVLPFVVEEEDGAANMESGDIPTQIAMIKIRKTVCFSQKHINISSWLKLGMAGMGAYMLKASTALDFTQ